MHLVCGENAAFQANEVLPNVYHISDSLGVCCTLLIGQTRALLLDTGYGLFDLREFIGTLTALPLTVLLSHGHHDHACGAAWFDEVFLRKEEMDICRRYTGPSRRRAVLRQALDKGALPRAYDQDAYLAAGAGNLRALREEKIELGGMIAQVLPMPGHTPGSLGLWVTPQRLLLPGDNWNPMTWVFFPESETVSAYADTLRGLERFPIDHVLTPHDPRLLPGRRFLGYIRGLTPRTFQAAYPLPIPSYPHIQTYACHPEPETTLVFDRDKWCR